MRIYKALRVKPKKIFSIITLVSFLVTSTFTFDVGASNDRVIYPLKEVSKLKCRFDEFASLGSECKEQLPILHTKDYKKYIKKDGGYNDFTRLYTVLWGASYKYGWDVGNGGHQGVDIATAKGTPVYSIADGTVIVAKKDPSRGNVVSVKHTIRGKEIVSNYAHLDKIDVKKGQIIKVGKKVGEVGNTGNSTGNHLHFQIDLAHTFHPFYYSWKTCPYGYYKITEGGVCFDELADNTLDPLQFLESEGGLLDNIDIKISSKKSNTTAQKASINNNGDSDINMNIFNKTIHTEMGSSTQDVKVVQNIYKDLGYYSGKIDGNFSNVEASIIKYQLDNNIVASKNANGAGWFGPKTRAHTKNSYLAIDNKTDTKKFVNTNLRQEETTFTNRKIEKISRANILTREEIEKREISEFLRNNTIDVNVSDLGGNIKVGTKFKVTLDVLKKSNSKKKRYYRGALPAAVTFEINEEIVSVFPKKITNISGSKRNIQLTGEKSGNTTLKVKLGNQVIKTLKLKVFGESVKIFPKTVQVLSHKSIVLGESKTAIALFKDEAGKKLVNLQYNGTFIVKTNDNTSVCVKKGSIRNISKIYKTVCRDEDYKKNPEITYKDTVGGLLIFDYKTHSTEKALLSIVGKGSGKTYTSSELTVKLPKGLASNYEYYTETVDMLKKGVVTGTVRGYFQEKKELTHKDALVWIENALREMQGESTDAADKAKITQNLKTLIDDRQRSNKNITRKEFFDKAHKYLVINDLGNGVSIEYRDLEGSDNKKVNSVFGKDTTWKDKFGGQYFQPKKNLSRGEAAYILSAIFEKNQKMYITLR